MTQTDRRPAHVTRRLLLGGVPALALAAGVGPRLAFAQEAPPADLPVPADLPETDLPETEAAPFSFDLLSEEMAALAAAPHEPPQEPQTFLSAFGYDDYRLVRFNAERARWAGPGSHFTLHAFSMGWLYKLPVQLFEVSDGQTRPMGFSTDDFEFLNELADRLPPEAHHASLPGVAGFRLHHPLNRPDVFDELVAFLGASYFRALGRGNAYGISARGLAINTGLPGGEEFPRFSRFYLERPAPGADALTFCAALESASVTGAYRFTVRPGSPTAMDVTARLFFRNAVTQIGIAPLTSMFLYSEKNRDAFNDYRPKVHDSDGLSILRGDGERIWRPLNNPPRLASSYFAEESPRSFGLDQRDREFAHYQDATAHYERRPSLHVEPQGDWGRGVVRLVEIPTDSEVNDNIVAFWVPEGQIAAGDRREFSYRLLWGDLPADAGDVPAYVFETRAGEGGVSGVPDGNDTRKFVIDFKGGIVGAVEPAPFPAEQPPIEAAMDAAGGEIVVWDLAKIAGTDIWRLAMDVRADPGAVVELSAHLRGYGRKLSENWVYQWIVS